MPCLAAEWSLERLYTRPYIWGTPPQDPQWPKGGNTLVFRWNAEGSRFMDLYAFDAGSRTLSRLTELEEFEDDLLLSEAEKDERRKRHLPPEAGIRDFALSRDGSKAAFSYKGDLFLVPTDRSAKPFRLTRTKAAETAPQFSPDGNKLASLRGGQIVVHNLQNGQLWQVTDVEGPDHELTSYRWAPDGSRFVYSARKSKVRQLPLPNYSGQFVTAQPFSRSVAGDEPPPVAIYLIPADGGKPVEVEMGDWEGKGYTSTPLWSKDSGRLVFRTVHPSMKKQQIRVAEARTGKSRAVFEEQDDRWVYWSEVGWSQDSKHLLFVSQRDGWAHIYTAPAAGGEPAQVTHGAWEAKPDQFSFQDQEGPAPSWIGDHIYYHSTEEGTSERHLYRIRPDGSGKERLSSRQGINVGRVSEDGRHIAWLLADLNSPADLYVDDFRVTNRTRPAFLEYPWPATRFIRFASRGDGKMVAAKILLPPGYNPEVRDGRKWPAVVFLHGAGYATSVLKQWGSYHELRYVFNCYLANQGYVILDVDYRGSSGYGRDWRSAVYLHLGGLDLQDVLGGVDYLESLGNIDMERLGIWGVSYGGFMTNMAMFLAPDTFQAGSSWASVNDWENYNSGYTRERLNTPSRNPEAFRRSSPVAFSGKLRNHLLIVHGMVDSNVLFQDAVQLAEKLVQEGKSFGQAYYAEESHGFVRDETWIDACRRTAEWFDRYLK